MQKIKLQGFEVTVCALNKETIQLTVERDEWVEDWKCELVSGQRIPITKSLHPGRSMTKPKLNGEQFH